MKALKRIVFFLPYVFFNALSFRHILPNPLANFIEIPRVFFIKKLGAKIGSHARIRNRFWCNNFSNLTIGNNGTVGINCEFYSYAPITIGDNFLIGSGLIIHTAEHIFSDPRKPIISQGSKYSAVSIGNNVYIGSRVTILPGVTIPDNTVIAAGSIVTKPLEEAGLYAGVPARKIRSL